MNLRVGKKTTDFQYLKQIIQCLLKTVSVPWGKMVLEATKKLTSLEQGLVL